MAKKNAVSADVDETLLDEADEVSADPFATDFFSQSAAVTVALDEDFLIENAIETEAVEVRKVPPARSWAADLPKISTDEIRKTLVLTELSPDFSENICQIVGKTFGQILLQNNSDLSCEIISNNEAVFNGEINRGLEEQAVFVNFSLEPNKTEAVLIVDAAFAVILIAKALGGEAGALIERRSLSATEIAVLEFFALNCLRRINEFAKEPLFRLRTVSQTAEDQDSKPCLLHNVRLRIGGGSGIVQLLLPFDFLANLKTNAALGKPRKTDKLAEFANLAGSVKLHAVLGQTVIEASDLAVLERDDVIIIERPAVRFNKGAISGRVQTRLADEADGSLYGELTGGESLTFTVRDINQKVKNYPPTRLRMPDETVETSNNLSESDLNGGEEGGLALEKITVTVAVELASRRLTLEELAQIRVGQTLELGTRAADPVELVADGRTVAIGELVDVEGTLGVRLTRVLL